MWPPNQVFGMMNLSLVSVTVGAAGYNWIVAIVLGLHLFCSGIVLLFAALDLGVTVGSGDSAALSWIGRSLLSCCQLLSLYG